MKAILVYIDKNCSNVIIYNNKDNIDSLIINLINKFCDIYAYKKLSNNYMHICTKDGRVLNVKWKHITLWDERIL